MQPSVRITLMEEFEVEIVPVRIWDLISITRLTQANMVGADLEFTRLVSSAGGRLFSYFALPINLLVSGSGYKAVSRGKIIGCAYIALRSHGGYVFNVFVESEYRRQGVGSLMMEHLEKVAKKNHKGWMALQVDRGNEPAVSLYKNLGYFAYHPCYYSAMKQNLDFRLTPGTIAVEPIATLPGRKLFRSGLRDEHIEMRAPAEFIEDLTAPETQAAGYFSCSVDGEIVGCIQRYLKNVRLKVELVLGTDQWGNWLDQRSISMIFGDKLSQNTIVEINLGSSSHHERIGPLLEGAGFIERTTSRFFMLKQIGKTEEVERSGARKI
jgi:GNAT superfamily N-acetyltransferase